MAPSNDWNWQIAEIEKNRPGRGRFSLSGAGCVSKRSVLSQESFEP